MTHEEFENELQKLDLHIENNRLVANYLVSQQTKKRREYAEFQLTQCKTLADFFVVKHSSYLISYRDTIKRILGPVYSNLLQVDTGSIVIRPAFDVEFTKRAIGIVIEAKKKCPWIEIYATHPRNPKYFYTISTNDDGILLNNNMGFGDEADLSFDSIKAVAAFLSS